MAPKKTRSQKAVLSRQEIAVRKRVISDQKLQSDGNARRVIVGIFTLAFSLLILLALATFESRDGIRGRYHNAIGPAGHFMASQVHQFLGICAYLLPLCGIYASLVLLIGSRAKRH
jgi:S-DNA-T family DNA segregation ATPase FtsK/SpoIIIE